MHPAPGLTLPQGDANSPHAAPPRKFPMENAFESPFNGIALLLEMKWWDWPDARLQAAMPLLTSGDIEALHRHWQQSEPAR